MNKTCLLVALLFGAGVLGAEAETAPAELAPPRLDHEAGLAEIHEASLAFREKVLRDTVAKDSAWPSGVWGEVLWSLAALYLNERVELANARIRDRAKDYIALHKSGVEVGAFEPGGTTETPWGYFALTDYVRILALFRADSPHYPGRLTAETETAMKEALWLWVKSDSTVAGASLDQLLVTIGTENHDLTRRPNHYLIAAMLQDDPAFRERPFDDGHTAAVHAQAYTRFFREWPRKRAATGMWIEIGSNTYQKYSWPALFNLHELAPDPVIRKRFGLLLDLAFIEEAQISVGGRRGGGRSRAEGVRSGFESFKNVFYAPEGGRAQASHSMVPETSRYQAPAAAVFLRKHLLPTREPFVIRNRVLGELERAPTAFAADSALVNYAWRTPHYLLGSTLQDPSLMLGVSGEERPDWKVAGISRQKRSCGLLFEEGGAAVYPVIEQTRGGRPQHAFWSVQHENLLLLQRIAPQTRKRLGSYSAGAIRIRFEGEGLDISEEEGWIFARSGKGFVGVHFLDGGYTWDEARRVAQPDPFAHATDTSRVLLHAGDTLSHGSFDQFQHTVISGAPVVSPGRVEIRLGGKPAQLVVTRFDVDQPDAFVLPTIDGVPINLRPAATWQSPFLNGAFGSDQISVTVGPIKRILDFSDEAMAASPPGRSE